MQQMAVSAEIIDAAECCIVEAGSRVACTLPEKRICDPSIGIVDDSHRRAHRGGKNIGRHGDHAVGHGDICAVYIFSEMPGQCG